MANSSKKKSGLQRGESKAAFLFCTPAVVLALVFIIYRLQCLLCIHLPINN